MKKLLSKSILGGILFILCMAVKADLYQTLMMPGKKSAYQIKNYFIDALSKDEFENVLNVVYRVSQNKSDIYGLRLFDILAKTVESIPGRDAWVKRVNDEKRKLEREQAMSAYKAMRAQKVMMAPTTIEQAKQIALNIMNAQDIKKFITFLQNITKQIPPTDTFYDWMKEQARQKGLFNFEIAIRVNR